VAAHAGVTALIELPFPPATLSGHNKGHWHSKSGIVAKHRKWAAMATIAASVRAPEAGDIRVSVTFYPPDRRGDRVNFPNRMKPYWDGIADALKINDSRFLPTFHFAEPTANAKVVIAIAMAPDRAANGDLPVPKDCLARAEGIAPDKAS
jgi:crossover junction endodeoxyribonuclease RusA